MTLADGIRRQPAVRAQPLIGLGWGAALLVYCGAAVWLAVHPAALPSDDALFFSRGLVRFSILDFSPQFPGYPGFIALGKLLLPVFGDPVRALFALTVALALALPPAAALFTWRIAHDTVRALAAFVLTLACPLLPDLALSLLSDGAGILFAVLALSALASVGPPTRRGTFVAGLALGWAACCRPSDAALFAGAVAAVAWRMPRLLPPLVAGVLLVALPMLAVLFALEGDLYLWAGIRFVFGHTMNWGHTVFSNTNPADGWGAALVGRPLVLVAGLIFLGAMVTVFARGRSVPLAVFATAFALLAHGVWVLLMQNPGHMRHLAPLAVLGSLLVANLPSARGVRLFANGVVFALDAVALALTTTIVPVRAPPLIQAAERIARQPRNSVLAINDGVALMRDKLRHVRVYDMQAPAEAALAFGQAGGGYRLSTTKLEREPVSVFAGRVAGEETQYLYPITGTDTASGLP